MPTIARKIIALDMLSQDMSEELARSGADASERYLDILSQYQRILIELAEQVEELTELQFAEQIRTSDLANSINSKQMLSVQTKLLSYVIEYHSVSGKAKAISESHFSEASDKRLNLLQTKAIKLRKQFKTGALALGEQDYNQFLETTPLPKLEWHWELINLP